MLLLVQLVELSILLIAAAGPLGQRGCTESRHPRLRLPGVEVVLVSQRRAGRDGLARLGGLRPDSSLDALPYLDAPLVRRRELLKKLGVRSAGSGCSADRVGVAGGVGVLRRLLESRMGRHGEREFVQVLRLVENFRKEEVISDNYFCRSCCLTGVCYRTLRGF